jgi:hypothetical protein
MLPGSCCTSNVKRSGGLREGPAHNELVRLPRTGLPTTAVDALRGRSDGDYLTRSIKERQIYG